MRQVRVLVSGKGIYYKHWDDGVACFKDRAITLATDFVKLWEEAREFENTHGRDRGNGWLLLHPITKLLCFQIYKVGQIGVCDSVDSENGKDDSGDEEKQDEEGNSEEEMEKQWLRYITTESNETLRTISNMDDAPSLKELLKNNRAQFPEIKPDSRLKIGTSIWIRQAVNSESEEEEEPTSKRRRIVTSDDKSNESPLSPKNKTIGRSVKKVFEGYGTFKGTVKSYNKTRRVYMVEYEDGDSEEMSFNLLKEILL